MPMFLFASALAIAPPQTQRGSAIAQATATVRVIASVRLKLDSEENPGAPRRRESTIKLTDGSFSPAKLIEFQ